LLAFIFVGKNARAIVRQPGPVVMDTIRRAISRKVPPSPA
jgi:hypothetical protein